MTINSRFLVNNTKLDNNYAQLECVNDDTMVYVPFIKEGYMPKIYPLLLEKTSFIITNTSQFTILAGVYDHRLKVIKENSITQAEKHEVKPNEKLKIKVPTLNYNSELQFYTIASVTNHVNINTYIPTSVDEYIPYLISTETNDHKSTINFEFQNFERFAIESNNSCNLNFTTFLSNR
jgi:hypothetical protein